MARTKQIARCTRSRALLALGNRGCNVPTAYRDSSSQPSTSTPPPTKKSRPSKAETEVIEEQIMPTTSSSPQIQSSSSKLYDMFTDKNYHDLVLISDDGTEIKSYRCILAKNSSLFRDRFKASTVLPVRIELPDFHAAIIQSALDFMLDKRDSIIGKEFNLLKFASQFGINDLMIAATNSIIIDASNVCDTIKLAYSNNFEELKQKCLKILAEKKKDIDPTKFAELDLNIFKDAFLQ